MRTRNLIALLLTLVSCVSPFDFKLDQSKEFLTVEGGIFEIDRSWVVVSKTANRGNSPAPEKILDAKITVMEDGKKEIAFVYDYDAERYFPVQEGFKGRAGHAYQLFIKLPSGEEYQSEEEEMMAAETLNEIADNYSIDKGVFEVTGELPLKQENQRFYLFKFVAFENAIVCASCFENQSYELQNPEDCTSLFKGCINTENDQPTPKMYGFACNVSFTCWNYWALREKVIYDDTPLTLQSRRLIKLIDIPLTTYARYFLQVNQYRISEEAHGYFELIDNAGSGSGTLIDPVPPLLTGNVHLSGDKEKKALGYFLVSGQNQYGHYVERSKAAGYPLVAKDPEKEVGDFRLGYTPILPECRGEQPPLAPCVPNNSFITDQPPVGWKFY